MSKKKLKVFHLEHAVYPYRIPLFEELSNHFDLSVYLCRRKKSFRQWDASLPLNLSFETEILKNFSIGPLTINFTLPFRLLLFRHDVYTVAGIDFITAIQFIVTFFISKVRGCPFILIDEFIETSWYSQVHPFKKKFRDIFSSIFYKYIDAFVAWNKKAAQYMEKQGVPQERIFIGPPFYPKEFLKEVNVSRETSPFQERTVVFTVSYLLPRKGIDILIKAFKELKRDDTTLIIAGKGKYETKLKTLARGDSRIKFLGYVDGVDKARYYKWADIFVLPTLWDPWGVVVNEAMYFGLPIISTDAAGSSDHLIKDNGFVVQAGDKNALKEALTALLDDEKLRNKMGKRSKDLIQECDVNAMMQPFIEAVEYVTNGQTG